MKIYTKTGDNGTSGLINGKRYKKSDSVFDCLGTLDELNATLGFVTLSKLTDVKKDIVQIQNDLFIMGSLVAGKDITSKVTTYFDTRLSATEKNIDFYESKNTPLTNFILPGGCAEAVQLHLARVICRKAERSFVSYMKGKSATSSKKSLVLQHYLNRLSDLLFVMARYANKKKKVKDTIWKGDKILK